MLARLRRWWLRRSYREPQLLWTAHNPFGFTEVGYMTRTKAIRMVSQWGKISYVDSTQGIIFYDTHLGRGNTVAAE
jgi:hypothetical protein